MATGILTMPMILNMLENLKMTKYMAAESINGVMVKYMNMADFLDVQMFTYSMFYI